MAGHGRGNELAFEHVQCHHQKRRQQHLGEAVEIQAADEQQDHAADDRPDIGREIQHAHHHPEEDRVGHVQQIENQCRAGAQTGVDDGDGAQVHRYAGLDLAHGFHRRSLMFELGNHPHQLAQKGVAGRQHEIEKNHAQGDAVQRRPGAGENPLHRAPGGGLFLLLVFVTGGDVLDLGVGQLELLHGFAELVEFLFQLAQIAGRFLQPFHGRFRETVQGAEAQAEDADHHHRRAHRRRDFQHPQRAYHRGENQAGQKRHHKRHEQGGGGVQGVHHQQQKNTGEHGGTHIHRLEAGFGPVPVHFGRGV